MTPYSEENIQRVICIRRSLRLCHEGSGGDIIEIPPIGNLHRLSIGVIGRVLDLNGVIKNEGVWYNIVPAILNAQYRR